MGELIFRQEVYRIAGAAMEVYNTLKYGFYEAVYQEALEIELASRGIPYESQKRICIRYKDYILQKEYIADVVCYGAIIIELKAIQKLSSLEESQILNYMKATQMQCGLLFNFGHPKELEWKRFIL
jgi:GxxExxY protein